MNPHRMVAVFVCDGSTDETEAKKTLFFNDLFKVLSILSTFTLQLTFTEGMFVPGVSDLIFTWLNKGQIEKKHTNTNKKVSFKFFPQMVITHLLRTVSFIRFVALYYLKNTSESTNKIPAYSKYLANTCLSTCSSLRLSCHFISVCSSSTTTKKNIKKLPDR